MGRCRAGHALWKTVLRFFLGEQGSKKGLMAGGLLAALSPSALIGGAIEMPLLGWARQAEITADRAGLLTVGNEEVPRRVLLSWSLKSPILYRQINVEAWLEQQSSGDDEMTRLSELTTSATPYITRRLKLMADWDIKKLLLIFCVCILKLADKNIFNSNIKSKMQIEKEIACNFYYKLSFVGFYFSLILFSAQAVIPELPE
ncbi:MAG TPA: hypothetical protein VF556_07280 [Pyrinomonadaceae bacterium]